MLAPAADKEVARQAILHGADAVYIGASSHGARSKAANSIEDIREVVDFAHMYRARVYVTVNTLVYENEISDVESLIASLYRIGVDAIIVQDMGILRMNIPPIELHASTQCDTRTPAKARFLEESGFSQIVLARELTLPEISGICESVDVPVECFVHGALCVCYSGRCQASAMCLGRSANRGECSQMCRLPYTLRNSKGDVLIKDKYLLSLSDFNASAEMLRLVEAGVSSFKIEGRLKDASYVKNVTAAYRRILDGIISSAPDKYRRSSYGESTISFVPDLSKSFNRGFTSYFLKDRTPGRMASLFTPKSKGEIIEDVRELNNGDGISWLNPKTMAYEGVMVNKVENGRILANRKVDIPRNVEIRRTLNRLWQQQLAKETAVRKVNLDIIIDDKGISAKDERGVSVRIPLDTDLIPSNKKMDPRPIFEKLGNTIYKLRYFTNNLPDSVFIPASILTGLRRKLTASLDDANRSTYPYHYRKSENRVYSYPVKKLESSDNVANSLSCEFYRSHGVDKIREAVEIRDHRAGTKGMSDTPVMVTRYCLRRELGFCKKHSERNVGSPDIFTRRKVSAEDLSEPLTISSGPHTFSLKFDCRNCEMHVLLKS